MATLRGEYIRGTGITLTATAYEKIEVYGVKGITGSTTAEREAAALSATGVPTMWQPLGNTNPLNLMAVIEKSANLSDDLHSEAQVTVRYSSSLFSLNPTQPARPIYTGGTDVREVNTNVDRNGNLITVTYNDDERAVSVPRRITFATLRAERIEVKIKPGDVADALVNKVSSATWNGPAGAWICDAVNYEWQGKFGTADAWKMSYEFIRAPEEFSILGKDDGGNIVLKARWNPAIVYEDADGDVPEDVTTDNGIAEVDLVSSVDFNTYTL